MWRYFAILPSYCQPLDQLVMRYSLVALKFAPALGSKSGTVIDDDRR